MQLPETATLTQATVLLQQIEASIVPGAAGLQIDASALKNFDTSLVAVLLAARRAAEAQGLSFQINGAPAKLAELAELYGALDLLPMSTSPSSPEPEPGRPAAT